MNDPRVYVSRVRGCTKYRDGDTYVLALDPGFHLTVTTPCRLLGWDCPEIKGPTAVEKARARDATDLANAYIAAALAHGSLYARTEPDPDGFGRWLADIWDNQVDLTLGETLASAGLATVWPTRWRDVYIKPTT